MSERYRAMLLHRNLYKLSISNLKRNSVSGLSRVSITLVCFRHFSFCFIKKEHLARNIFHVHVAVLIKANSLLLSKEDEHVHSVLFSKKKFKYVKRLYIRIYTRTENSLFS